MQITTSFWQKFPRRVAREPLDILEKVTKGSTGFFWECRRRRSWRGDLDLYRPGLKIPPMKARVRTLEEISWKSHSPNTDWPERSVIWTNFNRRAGGKGESAPPADFFRATSNQNPENAGEAPANIFCM